MIELIPPSQRLSAHIFADWSPSRHPVWVVVVKTSFNYNAEGTVHPCTESAPLILNDQYPDDGPEHCAPTAADEAVPFKLGSEILLNAHAFNTCTISHFPVKVTLKTQIQQWQKKLIVVGPRTWKRSLLGIIQSDPEPFSDLPIRYEYAYGGRASENEQDYYPPNPVGIGFSRTKKAVNSPLPQIERADELLKSPRQKPSPAGFGPLGQFWQPRAGRMPKTDETKLQTFECPYSENIQVNRYNAAPEDQWLAKPLAGPTTLTLTGLTEGLPANKTLALEWTIPTIEAMLIRRQQSDTQTVLMEADTLLIDTQQQRLDLVYRHAFSGLPETFQAMVQLTEQETKHG